MMNITIFQEEVRPDFGKVLQEELIEDFVEEVHG